MDENQSKMLDSTLHGLDGHPPRLRRADQGEIFSDALPSVSFPASLASPFTSNPKEENRGK